MNGVFMTYYVFANDCIIPYAHIDSSIIIGKEKTKLQK